MASNSKDSNAKRPISNAFTVDVEDWYQGIELPMERWEGYSSRLNVGLDRLLELLDANQIHATFFVLGWVAEHYPDLIKRIAKQGHEIGSHGFSHNKLYHLKPDEFRWEIRTTRNLLEDITGTPVTTFRSPFFSITPSNLWTLKILGEEGYTVDCSISPVKTWRYGISNCPDTIFYIADAKITEFPISSFKLLGKKWAIGGAYFRILPFWFTKRALQQRHKGKKFTMFYVHPWEYDPDHPKVSMERKAKLTHYANLGKTFAYTKLLLQNFSFTTVSQVVENYAATCEIPTITSDMFKN